MKKFKVSFSFRAFIVYFVILGSLSWYIVENALERLNDGMRQSAEIIMVDLSHIIAASLEDEILADEQLSLAEHSQRLERVFQNIKQRSITAEIYKVTKTSVDTDVYVTDTFGKVIYDSTGNHLGADYSQWRDVRLTLAGEYGARTSFKDQSRTNDGDEKIMVIAAPLKSGDNIIGVVSIVKSIKSLEGHLHTASSQLKRYALILVIFAIIVSYVLSQWFTYSLKKISEYAATMSLGKKTEQPQFWDKRLDELSSSVTNLRDQLDGKEYVENYIHSLTHELKTPITSIRGAAELLLEDMPPAEQKRFINNINASNNRMSQLVEKMLSLAKLESQMELVDRVDFDVSDNIDRLLEERQAVLAQKSIKLVFEQIPYIVNGDKLLIRQAIANLLDNAIDFCSPNGVLEIALGGDKNVTKRGDNQADYQVSIFNQGDLIPEYALPRIYERFFSLPRNHRDSLINAKSTGLGLSFVQEIMKLHQGKVSVENLIEGEKARGVISRINWGKPETL